ncbi:PucR family transcriptional regulator [Streptomyces inusitatus]|uniref:PucR family transcriptional regulator n=1 Tax=Streptomyces inusitatus TaxID=68221 RepID=A0A918QKT3_9ACTN|nr:PucR family transcriptional regulator [Streptomyces inusitatus]GGZ57365.1 PucR family transcriptional regulator [Streptomyces inusitatus]
MSDATAAPPTPPVPLAALLESEELGLRQIAGPSATSGPGGTGGTGGPGTVVHWVHASEMADPYPYLLGGELLLSAGVQLRDPDAYVARLVAARAAALGFGVTPVYDRVPAGLAEACDRHGLPLLEVPPRTTFTAVARAVWRLMAEARHRELRRVARAQQGLAGAAARPDPVPAVIGQLAARLGGRAVLLTREGAELSAAGPRPPAAVGSALVRLARVVNPPAAPAGGGAPATASDTVEGIGLAAYALGGGQGLTLGLATPAREAGDHTVAGVAVVLLSLLTAEHQGLDGAGRSAALVRLLLGAGPAEAAAPLGTERWTVVHGRGGPRTPFAATALGAALGSALVDPAEDGTVRVLVPADRDVTPQPGWTLGVSDPVGPAELTAADAQAARALRRATAARAELVRHRGGGLAALLAPEEAAAHARLRLAPLAGSPALLETLRTWLSLHGGWDRTAAALQVHRNTVRQRIARCAALLDEDLDDADVRMELWFALRVTPET